MGDSAGPLPVGTEQSPEFRDERDADVGLRRPDAHLPVRAPV